MIIQFILPQNLKQIIMLDTLDSNLESLSPQQKYQYYKDLNQLNNKACKVIKPQFNVLVSYSMDNRDKPNYYIPKQITTKDTKAKRIVTFEF